jgi:hypothetical protein
MTHVLSVETEDLDQFETDLANFLQVASAEEIKGAVLAATIFVENLADNPQDMKDRWTELNNATSLFNHVARKFVQ